MDLVDLLLGRPLATEEEKAERIGPAKGVPIFGLDALSSAAYGPEAALTLLIPLGMAGVAYIVPISVSIVCLLAIVYFSYRQTIMAYPQGGGSYTVASENLGVWPGLLAAASLMVDYVLTAAVGISAGVGALISAVPSLQKHTLALCLAILIVVTLINLRGVSEAGGIFLVPTYLFIFCLLAMIALGVIKTLIAGGHPVPVVAPPRLTGAVEAVSAWLLLRAFASGCTAMTGVEAVSNGVMAFKEPASVTARHTLTVVIGILTVMLLGIAFLCRAYGVAATPPGEAGYQSVLSQLLAAITGKGVFYGVSIGSILVVLALSANTAFADFPRLARAIAQNGFLPHGLAIRGRRLVYTQGIYASGLPGRRAAHRIRRRYRSPDRPLCRGRIHGLHPLPGRHGDALEARARAWRVQKHVRKWIGSGRDRPHGDRRTGRQVHRRRLDYAAVDSRAHSHDADGKAPLRSRGP